MKNTITINEHITRSATLRAVSDEMLANRQVEFVISSETPDTYNTVFRNSGWKLERYNQNPIVCYAHESHSKDPDMIIATSEVRSENGQLIALATFEPADVNPLAEKVFRKIQAGTLRMASIGCNITRGHVGDSKLGEDPEIIYFDEMELLEWSIVPLGSNPDALKREYTVNQQIRNEFIKNIAVTDVTNVTEKKGFSVREMQLINNQNS